MAWFNRGRSEGDSADAPAPAPASPLGGSADIDDELPERPIARKLGEAELTRIAAGLRELSKAGVDVDDLASLGAAFDEALRTWRETAGQGEGHDKIVERYAIGIGEHLHRHTDLEWLLVTDMFGTDLAVAAGGRGDFVVVPSNLVAARWMMAETGWIPGVVGHLVRRRSRR